MPLCSRPSSASWPNCHSTQARNVPRTLPTASAACACLQFPCLPAIRLSGRLRWPPLLSHEPTSSPGISEMTGFSTHTVALSQILLPEYFRPSRWLTHHFYFVLAIGCMCCYQLCPRGTVSITHHFYADTVVIALSLPAIFLVYTCNNNKERV